MTRFKFFLIPILVFGFAFWGARQWQRSNLANSRQSGQNLVSDPALPAASQPGVADETIRDVKDLSASEKRRLAEEQKQYHLSQEEIRSFAIEKAPANEDLPYREVTAFKDESGRLLSEALRQ